MPFEGDHIKDIGLELPEGPVCKFDSENGKLKSADDIFNGGVNFFLMKITNDRDLATRITRKNMKSLPYWQAHPFEKLAGPEATDAEFQAVMAKLGE